MGVFVFLFRKGWPWGALIVPSFLVRADFCPEGGFLLRLFFSFFCFFSSPVLEFPFLLVTMLQT